MIQFIKHYLIFSIALIFSINSFAQTALPLYEKNVADEYYLLRTDSVINQTFKNEISVITKNGIMGYGKMDELYLKQEAECCTHPDPYFLIGKFKHSFKIDSPYYLISEKIFNGKLFTLNFKTIDNPEKFITDSFSNSIIGNNSGSEWKYRWTKKTSEKYYLEIKDEPTYENQLPYYYTYSVCLNNCLYSKQDSFEILYCTADSDPIEFTNEPQWVFVYLNNKLLDARMDYSLANLDGYGPFVYQKQIPVGWYENENSFFLIYYPGYVLQHKNGLWNETYREPCKYYGECDCPE